MSLDDHAPTRPLSIEERTLADLQSLGGSMATTHALVLDLAMRLQKAERERRDLHDLVVHLMTKLEEASDRIDALEIAVMLPGKRGNS